MSRVVYTLARRGSGLTDPHRETATYCTAPAAHAAFKRMVYRMIEADGALDTAYGRAAMAKAETVIVAPPNRGCRKTWVVNLRELFPYPHVNMVAYRPGE